MPQMHLPFFPDGVEHITSELAFERKDGQVIYFNGHMPVFIHSEEDIRTFRMITAQFCINGNAQQADIARAFGITLISVKRAVKRYRDKGVSGFYEEPNRRGPAVLTAEVLKQAQDDADALRVGTWNIRWFPQGCSPAEECEENATDIEWLACTIVWMDLDLLAVQEILDAEPARVQLATLTDQLNGLTGGEWQNDLQACGPPKSQHVGFLWNRRAVSLSAFADVPAMNGASDNGWACAANLRPGRYARVQSTAAEGADFHVVSVHFDSGTANRDYQHRRTAASRIPFIEVGGTPLLESDRDVLVLGDFNTMGREEPPEVDAAREIETFDEELAPGFRRTPAAPACTEYFNRRPGTLDHVVVSAGMREAAVSGRVTGYCALLGCAEVNGAMPAAYERLSDHCPVLVEVTDADLD